MHLARVFIASILGISLLGCSYQSAAAPKAFKITNDIGYLLIAGPFLRAIPIGKSSKKIKVPNWFPIFKGNSTGVSPHNLREGVFSFLKHYILLAVVQRDTTYSFFNKKKHKTFTKNPSKNKNSLGGFTGSSITYNRLPAEIPFYNSALFGAFIEGLNSMTNDMARDAAEKCASESKFSKKTNKYSQWLLKKVARAGGSLAQATIVAVMRNANLLFGDASSKFELDLQVGLEAELTFDTNPAKAFKKSKIDIVVRA